jgi:sugar diacid utilization regulator
LNVADLDRLFRILQKKASEASDEQVATLQQQQGQTADLLKPHVTRVVVSDPRKNDLGKKGNRNDRHDSRELAELLYRNKVKSVYHGGHGLRTLKELARSYARACPRS